MRDAMKPAAVRATVAPATVLLLGGTQDARELAQRLASKAGITVVSSLAGRTAAPVLPVGRVRIGGFGGVVGLQAYLLRERIAAVVDATHPFAARISANAAAACLGAGVPLVALARPAWEARAGDRFIDVPDVASSARVAARRGRRIFVTVGRQELAPFAAVADRWFLIRTIDAPAAALLPPQSTVVLARGPFAYDDELRLLQAHRIDCIVAKNSGGAATSAKLDAARTLGIDVVLVARPQRPPSVAIVASLDAALAWLAATLAMRA